MKDCDGALEVQRVRRLRKRMRDRTHATTTRAVSISHSAWPTSSHKGRTPPEFGRPELVLAMIAAGPGGYIPPFQGTPTCSQDLGLEVHTPVVAR